jgi:hypothetical protein
LGIKRICSSALKEKCGFLVGSIEMELCEDLI